MAPISRENLQLIGQLSTIGFSFVFAIVIGFGGGYLLDQWLGSKPWLTFLGFFVGLAAGILNVYRVMQLADSPGRSPEVGQVGPVGSPPSVLYSSWLITPSRRWRCGAAGAAAARRGDRVRRDGALVFRRLAGTAADWRSGCSAAGC